MATYVMTDIHGEYDKFMLMLEQIQFTKADKLILLGDNVDRGPKNMAVLEFIYDNPNVESLIGNHELMMLASLLPSGYKSREVGNWFRNGGTATLADIKAYAKQHGEDKASAIIASCMDWKFYKFLEVNGRKFLCIHAGYWMASPERYQTVYGGDPETMLKDTPDIEKVWLRKDFYYRAGIPGYITLFGHTPTPQLHNSSKIWHDLQYKDKIGLDCGAAYNGLLACLRLDDMAEFYV